MCSVETVEGNTGKRFRFSRYGTRYGTRADCFGGHCEKSRGRVRNENRTKQAGFRSRDARKTRAGCPRCALFAPPSTVTRYRPPFPVSTRPTRGARYVARYASPCPPLHRSTAPPVPVSDVKRSGFVSSGGNAEKNSTHSRHCSRGHNARRCARVAL